MTNREKWNKIFEAEINAKKNSTKETAIIQKENNIKISSIILLIISAFLLDLVIVGVVLIFTAQAGLASKIMICILAVLMALFFAFSLTYFIKIKRKNK